MISPIEIMSISTVAMMNGIAARRPPAGVGTGVASAVGCSEVTGDVSSLALKRRRRVGEPKGAARLYRAARASWRNAWARPSLGPVVRRLLRDLHVVHVALADAGRGDLDELR